MQYFQSIFLEEADKFIAELGFIKKEDKVPKNEIERAIRIRMRYFESKVKK